MAIPSMAIASPPSENCRVPMQPFQARQSYRAWRTLQRQSSSKPYGAPPVRLFTVRRSRHDRGATGLRDGYDCGCEVVVRENPELSPDRLFNAGGRIAAGCDDRRAD